MISNRKTIKVLNKLIQINNDRFEDYETAYKETDGQDLKTSFSQCMQTSQNCKQELVDEVTRYGGECDESTSISGKLFRIWMNVKAALSCNDRDAILNSCEYGENVTIDTYRKVLTNDLQHLSFEQQTIINKQLALIKIDRDLLKSMHESMVAISLKN